MGWRLMLSTLEAERRKQAVDSGILSAAGR
jgi:hypothetical protein